MIGSACGQDESVPHILPRAAYGIEVKKVGNTEIDHRSHQLTSSSPFQALTPTIPAIPFCAPACAAAILAFACASEMKTVLGLVTIKSHSRSSAAVGRFLQSISNVLLSKAAASGVMSLGIAGRAA